VKHSGQLGFLPGLMFVVGVAQGGIASNPDWNWIQAQAAVTRAKQAEMAAEQAAGVQQALTALAVEEAKREEARQNLMASYGVLQDVGNVNYSVPLAGLAIFALGVVSLAVIAGKRKKSRR
jgi:hypothetical protein